MRDRFCCWFSFFILSAILTGCGSSGPRTYRIPGQLVYDDGTPVPGASVVLQTKVDDKVISARGMVGLEGKFELTTFHEGDGVVAGEHQVAISAIPVPDGVKPPPPIPPRYGTFETSGLTTSVTPSTKLIEIKIVRGK
ncbi:hypothetical protein [Anatilimnocola floriformis]|uniref:hypothetical protein n=1 Tax=Anatilimnocola floriformis TaxID=2948575 RepID=UPI0020C296C7|nr:hypothetical protein [Anatilimnocola floriformis]